MMWSLLFFMICLTFFFNFQKKLISILLLESLMICLIFFISVFCVSSFYPIFYIFSLSVLMVLESVFSISLFVSSIRNTSMMSYFFF